MAEPSFATIVNVPAGWLSAWENGDAIANARNLDRLADALHRHWTGRLSAVSEACRGCCALG